MQILGGGVKIRLAHPCLLYEWMGPYVRAHSEPVP